MRRGSQKVIVEALEPHRELRHHLDGNFGLSAALDQYVFDGAVSLCSFYDARFLPVPKGTCDVSIGFRNVAAIRARPLSGFAGHVSARHYVDLQLRICYRHVCGRQSKLSANDIRALGDGARLVERDFAVRPLASETTVA